jgi:dTMP kinase
VFITFEGIEGCGKTTQIKRLSDRLKKLGIPHTCTLEPGGTAVGRSIRSILLSSANYNLSPLCELLLYAADRAQHVREVVEPELIEGKWVLCDRFFDATTVYQGYVRGEDMVLIDTLRVAVARDLKPDLTILLDCPAEIGIKRALRRNNSLGNAGADRFERENMAFHRGVRSGYLELAKNEPTRFRTVDATLDIVELEERIFQMIAPHLPGSGD